MKKSGWIIGGAVLALVLLLGSIYAGYTGAFGNGTWGMMGGRGMMGGYGPMMGGWGGLGMLLFWVLVIGGIVWLIIATTGTRTAAAQAAGESPLDILKRRYAAGELNKEQFDEMKQNLAH